jgi:hypothetical protein
LDVREVETDGSGERGPGIGKWRKKSAEETQNAEKSIEGRKILDKKKGRVIFQCHASVFVLGVL